jgi:hypothetical protein
MSNFVTISWREQFTFLMKLWSGLMVFNATFNNISVISWQSVLLVEEIRVAGENNRPVLSQVTDKLYHIMCSIEYSSP